MKHNSLRYAAFFSLFIVIGTSALYAWWFGIKNDFLFSIQVSSWGAFGDYLNPFITLATLIWLGTAVYLQQKELTTALESLQGSADAQSESARIQRTSAQLTALSSKLNTIQGEIGSLRSDIRYHANANSRLSLTTGKPHKGRDIEIQELNTELKERIREKKLVLTEIDILLSRDIAKTVSAAEIIRHITS